MNGYYFDRPTTEPGPFTIDANSSVEHLTITGQVLLEADFSESEETYPLRYKLQSTWREILNGFRNDGFVAKDLWPAINHFRNCIWKVLDEITEGEEADDAQNYRVGGLTIDGDNMRTWVIYSDPFTIIEACFEELDKAAAWTETKPFSYRHMMGVSGLWAIDEAVYHMNSGQHYKAAIWALRAADSCDFMRLAELDVDAATSTWAIKGSDARHAHNRAAKDKAIKLFQSRTWISQAAAARYIAAEVNRTELTVVRWIRDFRKMVPVPAE